MINVENYYKPLTYEQPFHSHIYEKHTYLLLNYYTRPRNKNDLHTLSYFRPDRFVQLISLMPILISLLYLLVSIDLECTGLLRVGLLEKATKF